VNLKQNYVNHIALVLDASSSMDHLQSKVIEVADQLIIHLAQRSEELNQETRITVYTFADSARCVFYDKDVLRLPSLKEHYRTNGMTALVDATLLSLDDLAKTPEIYGDHAFLVYVITDGGENRSRNRPATLIDRLGKLPGHWTVATLVPDEGAKRTARVYGFPEENSTVWDATTVVGLEKAATVIRTATESFMVGRSQGVRGTKNLFGGASVVNDAAISAAGLKPLSPSQYFLIPVPPQPADKRGEPIKIKEFVEGCNYRYQIGKAYYQLNKREKIQGNKAVAVVEKKTSRVFVGPQARQLVGLPDTEVRANPDTNPDYQLFIQSTSVNRYLEVGTKLLILQ
jgi:hypothetical protein